jgi:hypothetical protein
MPPTETPPTVPEAGPQPVEPVCDISWLTGPPNAMCLKCGHAVRDHATDARSVQSESPADEDEWERHHQECDRLGCRCACQEGRPDLRAALERVVDSYSLDDLPGWSQRLDDAMQAARAALRAAQHDDQVEEIVRRLVVGFEPFDDVQGKCLWCEAGWEQVPGPRGGKGKWEHTGRHNDGCPFAEAQAALRNRA